MLDVLIDSCIFRADRKRSKSSFRIIARLARAGKLRVHIPVYVKNEVISQQQEDVGRNIRELESTAEAIVRTTGAPALTTFSEDIVARVAAAQAHVKEHLATEFQEWMQEVRAVETPLLPDHGQRVTDAYFAGAPPFRSPKHRPDIPDSFIWEAALDIAKNCELLYVVSKDGRLRETAGEHDEMEGFATLDEFIEEACQDELAELIPVAIAKNVERIKALLPGQTEKLISYLENDVVNELAEKTVTHESIPDDNNEGIITSVDSPTNVQFDFAAAEHYGDGDIGIPFTATVDCELNFAIYKGDYYSLSNTEHISISERNSHYYDCRTKHTQSASRASSRSC